MKRKQQGSEVFSRQGERGIETGEIPQSSNQGASSGITLASSGLLLAASWMILYIGEGIVPRVANLFPLQLPDLPYFQPTYGWLLYVQLPLVILASLVMFLTPGVLLMLAVGGAKHYTELVILGFGTSFLVHLFLTSAFKVTFSTMNQATFIAAEGGIGALAWAVLAWRRRAGAKIFSPCADKNDRRRILWSIAIPVVGLLALLPVMFWQDLSADGFGALESGRSLFGRLLPRWPEDVADGLLGLGIGMIPMAYPINWFITLFGLIEAAARLPILLYLPVLFCLLIQLIEFRAPGKLGVAEEAVLFLSLAVYTVAMSYNASYDPYFADIASPAAFESLTVVSMLAAIYSLWNGRNFWFFFFALMAYLCRPTGLLILGLLGLSIALCVSEQRREWLIRITVALGMCLVIGLLYEKVYIPSVVGDINVGYSSKSILERFRYLRVDDFSRINLALFPGGILPFISLLAFRWQDSFGRIIAAVTLVYFGVFYFPAFIAFHQFVPAIIFPLVVFWRLYLFHKDRSGHVLLPMGAVAAGVSLWLSLPHHFEINRTQRQIGQATDYRVAGYTIDYQMLKHASLLLELISPDWDVTDPSQELVVSPYSIIFYSLKPKTSESKVNYIIQPLGEPSPPGFTKITDDKIAGLYVRDLEQWHRDRFRRLRTDYQSQIYYIPRGTLFRHWGVRQQQYSIDLGSQRLLWRVFGSL